MRRRRWRARDPVALASFEALRLNMGTSDTVEAHLLQSGTWKAAEGEAAAVGDYVLGLDLGSHGSYERRLLVFGLEYRSPRWRGLLRIGSWARRKEGSVTA